MIPNIDKDLMIEDNGKITWEEQYLPYDPAVFYQGKKVTNEEFNRLFVGNAAQGNYLTKSLKRLTEGLDVVVSRKIETLYDLKPSFLKTFVSNDWGTVSDDGYYYITIPATVHGYVVETGLDIDVEMYILDPDNNYYEVSQVTVDTENTVTLYTDTPVTGLIVIRTNSRAIEYAANTIDVKNIAGLAAVARTGDYNALIGKPDQRFKDLETFQQNIENGTIIVPKAQQAEKTEKTISAAILTNIEGVEPRINGHLLSEIFEDDGITVKKATTTIVQRVDQAGYAEHASKATNATNAEYANTAKYATNAEYAASATTAATATHATQADTAGYAEEANHAASADHAVYADQTQNAVQAATASYADTAGTADTATHASAADKATNADNATNAERAAYATVAEKLKDGGEAAVQLIKYVVGHTGQVLDFPYQNSSLQFFISITETSSNTKTRYNLDTMHLLSGDNTAPAITYTSNTITPVSNASLRLVGNTNNYRSMCFKLQWRAYNQDWVDVPNNSGGYTWASLLGGYSVFIYCIKANLVFEGV